MLDLAASLTPAERANSTEIDLGGAAFKARAREHLAAWAKRPPFYVFNNGPAQVIVGRYADVQEVFTDPARFSSEVPRAPGYEQHDKMLGRQFLTQMDGEKHARMRRLIMFGFTPKRLAQIEERIVELVDDMLDEIERGAREFDAMNTYAARLVVAALLTAMLNLEEADKQLLLDYQDMIPSLTALRPGETYTPSMIAMGDAVEALVRRVLDERRDNPRADFLGDLVAARDHDDRFSDRELIDVVFGMFGATATTPRSASGMLHVLGRHPEQMRALVDDPTLIPEAVEECLRIAGNGYFTFARIATCDTEVGGTRILKGMVVRPSPQAANYDPDVFPDPMTFDILRKPRRIMTFGAGPHHCLGSGLGRMTLNVALKRFLARLPDARLADPDFEPAYGGATGELRMKSLPMLRH